LTLPKECKRLWEENSIHKQLMTYQEVKEKINQDIKPYSYLFSWGRLAPQEEILCAARDLLREKKTSKLIKYLKIFRVRPFPLKPNRLIELAESKNATVAKASIYALNNLNHKSIRRLAILLLRNNPYYYDVLELLVHNYKKNDYRIIEKMVFKNHDRYVFHKIEMDVLDIFQENITSACTNIIIHLYKFGFCSYAGKNVYKY
jgi:hypothetical protein